MNKILKYYEENKLVKRCVVASCRVSGVVILTRKGLITTKSGADSVDMVFGNGWLLIDWFLKYVVPTARSDSSV